MRTCELFSAGLIALLDGTAITGGRTAATTALAVDALGINGPLTVGLLGSGFEAREHARALASLHGIASLTVFSPNPESRKAFADELGPELGIRIEPVKSPEEVLESASVLICAARSRDETPIFRGSKLPPATLVLSIGSTVPEQREIDADTVRRASVIFADSIDEVMESGDMVAARLAGVLIEDKIKSLADLVSGRTTVRQTGEGIVLYKSVGSALQDISVAAMCVERARERGLGTVLPCSIQVNQK
jgi:alanine dehydrogenase